MIYVPFTFIHPPTWEALDGETVSPVKVDQYDGYLEYFRRRWLIQHAFINVEHDVVVQSGQILELLTCQSGWCCFPELGGSPSLSLVKFSAEFIIRNDELWSELWVLPAGQGPSWTHLDSHLVAHADRSPCLHKDPPCVNTRPLGALH